ncbi:solute carrier family 25 member 35-like isoform X2 [Varroa jacobsoni]|uniref:Solute carrier family 25 member 35 n=1 Tax=Varroa destructor TaxID=109461 RepID=A0A7M7MAL7_VARDE|nr:solute carrier family 25 member 35-like isoform X2 [Varroa destructor]XP_022699599.1 solute carrier family 25 member 35-like isoform X2 [Varroa jacobsoni]
MPAGDVKEKGYHFQVRPGVRQRRDRGFVMEFVLGGVAAAGAGFFTNPLDVVKTRIQLQGELQNRGTYKVHYNNTLHACYQIAKHDGVLALQSGMGPALWFQFVMNGTRLGTYSILNSFGLTRNHRHELSYPKNVLCGAFSGAIGSFIGSPLYLVKTQIQSQSLSQNIAVGFQHKHASVTQAFLSVYRKGGCFGLWRGANAAMVRVSAGSAIQLSTFTTIQEKIMENPTMALYPNTSILIASFVAGIGLCLAMTPFDVLCTRLYNQGIDPKTRLGIYYSGFFDCFIKMAKTEGFWGFYKGVGASYLRLGPHTVLTMMFWTNLKEHYDKLTNDYEFLALTQLSAASPDKQRSLDNSI